MAYPTTASEQTYVEVTGGVDTHKDTHTAAALDASGRLLGHREFAATARSRIKNPGRPHLATV